LNSMRSNLPLFLRGGMDGYIFGSELQANLKRMDTSYALK